MRFQFASDLHFEFYEDHGRAVIASMDPSGTDVLVLAGDVGNSRTVVEALRAICARFAGAQVIFVLGNHELYGSSPDRVIDDIRRLEGRLDNLHFLNHETVGIDGVTFAGTPLWFRDDLLNAVYKSQLNDFVQIEGYEPWVYRENEKALVFLGSLPKFTDVVVTHYQPTPKVVVPIFRTDPLNGFFVCPVDDVIETLQPAYWIFGHSHAWIEATIGRTCLVANQRGYPHEMGLRYRPKRVVDICGGSKPRSGRGPRDLG